MPVWSRLVFCSAVLLAAILSRGVVAKEVRAETRHSETLIEPRRRMAEPAPETRLSKEYFIGSWEFHGQEFGRDVRIIWNLWGDGRLAYDFIVDGVPLAGSTGNWNFRDGVMYEHWLRPDGTTGDGRGSVERIDQNTLRLIIIDNGSDNYRGMSRIYRRRGPPQLVEHHRSPTPTN